MNGSTEYDRAPAALADLNDEELAAFVRKLDAALKEARLGPQASDLNELTTIAASARILLRSRRAATAGERARAIVRELLRMDDE